MRLTIRNTIGRACAPPQRCSQMYRRARRPRAARQLARYRAACRAAVALPPRSPVAASLATGAATHSDLLRISSAHSRAILLHNAHLLQIL